MSKRHRRTNCDDASVNEQNYISYEELDERMAKVDKITSVDEQHDDVRTRKTIIVASGCLFFVCVLKSIC